MQLKLVWKKNWYRNIFHLEIASNLQRDGMQHIELNMKFSVFNYVCFIYIAE